jgi:hypothetical protein
MALLLFLGVVAISMPLLGRETAPHDEREFRRDLSLSLSLSLFYSSRICF